MSDEGKARDATASDAELAEARRLVTSGVVIGALDLAALGVLGVSCPLCVVGAPALVGWGAYRWWRVRRARASARDHEPDVPI